MHTLWADDQRESSSLEIRDNHLVVHNFRNARFEKNRPETFETHYQTKIFDLRQFRSVDLVIAYFCSHQWLCHPMLIFHFTEGETLALSIEARRRVDQTFHPFKGLFRQYPLITVLSSQKDIVGLRTDLRGESVVTINLHTSPTRAKEALEQVAQDIKNRTKINPFYHTIFNQCTSNLAPALEILTGQTLPWWIRYGSPHWLIKWLKNNNE